MMSRQKKGIIASAGVIGAIAGLTLLERIASNHLESRIENRTDIFVPDYSLVEPTRDVPSAPSRVRAGPIYEENIVPANNCSRYVRLSAKDMFGIQYPSDDAWNLRNYKEKVETVPVNFETLIKNASDRKINSGDIVAFYNPNSKYNIRPAAQKAGYTHVMLYLGEEDNELYFADKFGKKTRTKVGLTELKNSGLRPVEIIRKKN